MFQPSLIDANSKIYISNVLQKCHENRTNVYYFFFNLGIFITFVLIFGLALYYSYVNKPSEYEKYQKRLKDQEYILSKIRFHKQIHNENQAKMSNITNLPVVI